MSFTELLEKKTYIFINKFLPENLLKESTSDYFPISELPAPVLMTSPCYCDMLNTSRREIYTLEKPEHEFSKKIYEVAERI